MWWLARDWNLLRWPVHWKPVEGNKTTKLCQSKSTFTDTERNNQIHIIQILSRQTQAWGFIDPMALARISLWSWGFRSLDKFSGLVNQSGGGSLPGPGSHLKREGGGAPSLSHCLARASPDVCLSISTIIFVNLLWPDNCTEIIS